MKKELSCGTIVVRKGKEGFEFLLVLQRGADFWGFPKGHVEEGESHEATAKRETAEETGINTRIIKGFKESINYIFGSADKTVIFFLAVPEGDGQELRRDPVEISDAKWLLFEEALETLTFKDTKEVLVKAKDFVLLKGEEIFQVKK